MFISSVSDVQIFVPSQFYFCAEMTMPHGVVVIKCASRGFEWLGLLRLNFQLRYSREFFPLVNYALPLAEYNR